MAAGPRFDRDDLLARVDLPGLLEALTGQSALGGRWHCPDRDHPDVHPSVTVTVGGDGEQRWRCWSGDHHGTAIDAVMATHRVDVAAALAWLGDHCGAWPVTARPAPPPAAPPAGQPQRSVVDYVQRAERLLWTPAGRPQRDWLTARGLGEEVLRANRVGADPGRRFLPRPAGFPAGWTAVVYPALSPGGAVTYFQARYLDPPSGRDRYDNPARRHATNPRVAWLHPPGRQAPGLLVVTEGVADGLVAAQAGFGAVAVLGSQYPDAAVADRLAAAVARSPGLRHATVAVCFDADPAGRAGADHLGRLLDARHVPWRTLAPPAGGDLTDWARHDPAWWRQLAPTATGPAVDHPVPPPTTGRSPSPPTLTGPELGIGLAGLG